ncbi:uncharacterized protein SPSK_01744 [Sporothrix schenckii 1099-18]|uniref:Uncharacterized protein n=1 Tax=Sporothrix schenckii 1099-18 TaxID=1397361 RepID=A0A0F2MD98_SPOSC|nr:uncharacterized protein SPSK_01744 [Sporothrix schenckii 1099-18]KJR87044.1 hypothetical protein SPSK_01744 [Sporothrix schenckii 1099-18]
MAWDSNAALASRRRTNSSANRTSALATLTMQQKVGTAVPVHPKSAHVADPFLQDFLQPGFDPAAYWNATLGGNGGTGAGAASGVSRTRSPAPTSASTSGAAGRLAAAASSATATADRAAQAQATLSQLGAHTSRLTTVLTQLTDDILRSGRRLAYEVQLLRGETLGLGEVVEKHLALLEESESGIAASGDKAEAESAKTDGGEGTERGAAAAAVAAAAAAGGSSESSTEPPSLAQLRMLAQVRSRLDAVIRTFGEAMEFIMPPSTISVTSGFLSVSGPDQESGGTGSARAGGSQDAATMTSMEDKGQSILRGLRDEIAHLLDGANVTDGAEAAAARVEALRTLCRVWAGTAEEKARLKFIESLQRMVEDKQRELDRERERIERQQREKLERESSQGNGTGASGGVASSAGQGAQLDGSATGTGASRGYAAAGYGFISQLQKIRSGL